MFLRHLTFLKIAREDFSDIIVDREFHADRVIEENVPPEENFRRFMSWVRELLRRE